MTPNHSEKWAADAEAIRDLRLQRDLSIPEAARLIREATGTKMHYKSLDKIERGVVGASERMIRRIATGYGVKPDQLRKQVAA